MNIEKSQRKRDWMLLQSQTSMYDGWLNQNYRLTTLIIVPIVKIKTKNTKEKVNPLMESTTSLFFDCGFSSNLFMSTPPISHPL